MGLARTLRWTFTAAAVLAMAHSAVAGYILVDDFESYTTGNANAGGSNAFTANGGIWQPRDGAGNIVGSGLIQIQSDPNDGGNKHLAFGWNAGTRSAYRPVTPILDGSVGTYYFQIRTRDATPDQSYGLSDQAVATNAAFGDFEVQVALVTNTGAPAFGARNGASFQTLMTGLSANTWYDVWVVVDNAADTYDVYFGTTGDPNTLGTLVADDFVFRNSAGGAQSNDLVTFMVLEPNGNPADSQAHLDDINYNPNAVPEPASLLLAAVGLAAACGRRRRD